MSLYTNGDITNEALISRFKSAVVDNILSGVYHAGNPPTCRGYQCVPSSKLDHINNVQRTPNIGNDGNIVNATTVLNGLIAITRDLTRVGTFAFTVWMRHSTGGIQPNGSNVSERVSYQQVDSASGKALFTKSYVRSSFNGPSDKQGTVYGEIIKANNLNQLLSNIFTQWSRENRHQHTGEATICHVVCHNNCHFNCHENCHSACHGWTIIKDNGMLK